MDPVANTALTALPIAIAPFTLLFPTTGGKVLFGALMLSYVIVVLDLMTRRSVKGMPLWLDVVMLIGVLFLVLYFFVNCVWDIGTQQNGKHHNPNPRSDVQQKTEVH